MALVQEWYLNILTCAIAGLEHVDNCTQCDRGKFCDTPGLMDVRGPCDAGYLCHGGAFTSGPLDGVTGRSIVRYLNGSSAVSQSISSNELGSYSFKLSHNQLRQEYDLGLLDRFFCGSHS